MNLWAEWMLKSKCSIKLQLFNVYDMVHIIITALQPEKSCELHLIVNQKKKNHEMVHYIATHKYRCTWTYMLFYFEIKRRAQLYRLPTWASLDTTGARNEWLWFVTVFYLQLKLCHLHLMTMPVIQSPPLKSVAGTSMDVSSHHHSMDTEAYENVALAKVSLLIHCPKLDNF